MASYRVYCLDGAGHIGLAEWFEAEDDSAALALTRQMKHGALKWELWLDNRLIGTFSCDDIRPKAFLSPELHAPTGASLGLALAGESVRSLRFGPVARL